MKDVRFEKIVFVEPGKAELRTEYIKVDIAPTEVFARTIVSVVSSGSETGGFMDYFGGGIYPIATGYAAVMEVLKVGENVRDFSSGDVVFADAPHQSYQLLDETRLVKVPKNMNPEHAVLSRFPAISMTSMLKTKVRPTEPVLITGLGIVGLMCAQVMKHCGYDVHAVDPNTMRRKTAEACGVIHTYSNIEEAKIIIPKFGLGMECSGNDSAIYDMLNNIRKGGEMFLIGVPWKQSSSISAHALYLQIFYGYVSIHSGWEWSLPRKPSDFFPNSTQGNLIKSLKWIRNGEICVNGIYGMFKPRDCEYLYPKIAQDNLDVTCAIFKWH